MTSYTLAGEKGEWNAAASRRFLGAEHGEGFTPFEAAVTLCALTDGHDLATDLAASEVSQRQQTLDRRNIAYQVTLKNSADDNAENSVAVQIVGTATAKSAQGKAASDVRFSLTVTVSNDKGMPRLQAGDLLLEVTPV